MSGLVSYLAGEAAEGQVARHYAGRGLEIIARRWRGKGGEIDLIARDGRSTIFIEVKKGRNHALAVTRLSRRQIARLYAAASEYLGTLPGGLNSDARFDVALVDEMGRIDVIENAICA